MMRGSDATSGSLFSYVDVEERIPATHPLRTIRTIVNEVLVALDAEFEALYEGTGRQSIAPAAKKRAYEKALLESDRKARLGIR